MTPDDRLATLLSDAVSDVEPTDRLGEIRDRTRVVPLHSRRSWLFGVGGAVVATAAVVTAIALAGGPTPDRADGGPASSLGPTPSSSSTVASTPPLSTVAFAVYYVGEGPRGPVLFREFHAGTSTTPKPQLALEDLSSQPQDPDYSTPWHAGDLVSSRLTHGVIRVTLGSSALHDRPAGMSSAYAGAAVQQVVYTMQAAYGTRSPVQFVLGPNPIDQVLGVATSEPIANVFSALSLMSITSPVEDQKVTGRLKVSGVASSYEATVHWELIGGDRVVKQGIFTATGWMGHLYPFAGTVDLSDVTPGQYVLRLSTDDPSGGAGYGPDVDTRLIEVK